MLKSSFTSHFIEAGCDEAGRGCLAGPVFAAAVILPKDYKNALLNDSKKLSENKRYALRELIEKESLAFAVAYLDNHYIDKHNILNASIAAMQNALDNLKIIPEFILVDGNRFKPYKNIPYECIVKGDGKYMSIAAASILAKTYRDDFMLKIADKHPEYQWHKNKGYPTASHIQAYREWGTTPFHRLTFKVDGQLKINF